MRESENSEGVLRRYESPVLRVVPTDGGRIVVESFIGNTSLGVFGGDDDAYNWNEALATDGSLGGFTPGAGLGWASVDGGGIGNFTNGDDSFWNAASATGGSLGGFGPGAGSALQWDDSTTP